MTLQTSQARLTLSTHWNKFTDLIRLTKVKSLFKKQMYLNLIIPVWIRLGEEWHTWQDNVKEVLLFLRRSSELVHKHFLTNSLAISPYVRLLALSVATNLSASKPEEEPTSFTSFQRKRYLQVTFKTIFFLIPYCIPLEYPQTTFLFIGTLMWSYKLEWQKESKYSIPNKWPIQVRYKFNLFCIKYDSF